MSLEQEQIDPFKTCTKTLQSYITNTPYKATDCSIIYSSTHTYMHTCNLFHHTCRMVTQATEKGCKHRIELPPLLSNYSLEQQHMWTVSPPQLPNYLLQDARPYNGHDPVFLTMDSVRPLQSQAARVAYYSGLLLQSRRQAAKLWACRRTLLFFQNGNYKTFRYVTPYNYLF